MVVCFVTSETYALNPLILLVTSSGDRSIPATDMVSSVKFWTLIGGIYGSLCCIQRKFTSDVPGSGLYISATQ